MKQQTKNSKQKNKEKNTKKTTTSKLPISELKNTKKQDTKTQEHKDAKKQRHKDAKKTVSKPKTQNSKLTSLKPKTLIIFYSLDGNCKHVANVLSKEINADILELKPKKDISKKGVIKIFWGAWQIVTKKQPELMPFKTNIEDYNLIVFGSPVWVGTYAPSMNSLLKSISLKNKNIALYCCFGGNEANTFVNFKKALPNNNFLETLGLKEPLKQKDKCIKEIKEFAKKIKK